MQYPDIAKPYIGFIEKCIKECRITSNSISKNDLRQEAYLAIFRASQRYNPQHISKAKLTTYTMRSIRNAILSEATKFYGRFKLPQGKALIISKFITLLKQKSSNEEISLQCKLSQNDVTDLRKLLSLRGTSRDAGYNDPEYSDEIIGPVCNTIFYLKAIGYSYLAIQKIFCKVICPKTITKFIKKKI